MKILLSVLFLSLFQGVEKRGCLELDVVLLIDISGSIQGHEHKAQEAVKIFLDGLELADDGIMVSIVTFSSEPRLICSLSSDKTMLKGKANDIISDNGATYIASGLYLSVEQLLKVGREGVKKMIIVISDGQVADPETSKTICSQLKVAMIGICSVLILTDVHNRDFMRDISNGCYIESSYDNLPKEIKKLDMCI